MIFDDERKCLELGNKVLCHYRAGLDKDCSLKLLQLSENVTYLVENKTEPVAVLRLCRPGYHTPEELRAEMAWMEELRVGMNCMESARFEAGIGRLYKTDKGKTTVETGVSGIRLRRVIRTDEGDYLCAAEDEPGRCYYGAVFTYLPGVPLEELSCKDQIPWFEKLGEVTAFLHRQARERLPEMDYLPRFHWNYETMIGRKALWGDWRNVLAGCGPDMVGDISVITGVGTNVPFQNGKCVCDLPLLEQADTIIRHKLMSYGMTKDNYGLIHGDLRGANLLVSGDTLGIIDFDDCGYGWYMQDLAASLSFMETSKEVPELIEAWCRGYRKREVLRKEDLDMADTFIMMRRLQLLAWIETRDGAASARRYHDNFLAETMKLADRYIQNHLQVDVQ